MIIITFSKTKHDTHVNVGWINWNKCRKKTFAAFPSFCVCVFSRWHATRLKLLTDKIDACLFRDKTRIFYILAKIRLDFFMYFLLNSFYGFQYMLSGVIWGNVTNTHSMRFKSQKWNLNGKWIFQWKILKLTPSDSSDSNAQIWKRYLLFCT